MLDIGNSVCRESVKEINVKCPMKANWFPIITFVEKGILIWGSRINKETKMVQINLKNHYISGLVLATGTQQEVPNIPIPKKLKL